MTKSKIEWTDVVWNPVTGRPPVDPFMDLLFQMAEDMTREKFQIYFIFKMMKRGDLLQMSAMARRN